MLDLIKEFEDVEVVSLALRAQVEQLRAEVSGKEDPVWGNERCPQIPLERVPLEGQQDVLQSQEQVLRIPLEKVPLEEPGSEEVVSRGVSETPSQFPNMSASEESPEKPFETASTYSLQSAGDKTERVLPHDSTVEMNLPGFRLCSTHEMELEKSLFALRSMGSDRSCLVVSPANKYRVGWDVIMIVFLLFQLWQISFELVFMRDDTMPPLMVGLLQGTTGYFAADIVLNFCTGFYDKDRIIMTRREICWKYLRVWFWLDVLTTVPYRALASYFDTDRESEFLLRFSKGLELTKVLRLLKLFRTWRVVMKLVVLNVAQRWRFIILPVQVGFFMVIIVHTHAVIWAGLHTTWEPIGEGEGDFERALRRYCESFHWACIAFLAGELGPGDFPSGVAHWILNIVITFERLVFLAFVATSFLFISQCYMQEDVRLIQMQDDALEYLNSHSISIRLKMQVLYLLGETGKARNMQRRFRELMEHNLPQEIWHKVAKELWQSRLLNLGLVSPLARVHDKFAEELALVVREEVYAVEVVLFKYGDPSLAAYNVLRGSLQVVMVHVPRAEEDFRQDQWIGEVALVNPALRRNRTVVSRTTSTLMMLPATGFQEVLTRLGLDGSFRQLLRDHLWKGLCGRCGKLGDHFPEYCPTLHAPREMEAEDVVYGHNSTYTNSDSRRPKLKARISTFIGSPRNSPRSLSEGKRGVRHDLRHFLIMNELQHLERPLRRLHCRRIEDLAHLSIDDLRSALPPGVELSEAELEKLSPESISRFLERAAASVQRIVFDRNNENTHYIFLSHCKSEAGTEAALMRTELESLLREGLGSVPALKSFKVPVFLDSDNLTSLESLKENVCRSHNLAVLLTNEVLHRPWVLVEIVQAMSQGLQLLPVQVSKPGNTFVFPDEGYYSRLAMGEFLTLDGHRVLREAGVSLRAVEKALRALFTRIAVSYSPHRAAEIRKVELRALLDRCTLRKASTDDVSHVRTASENGNHVPSFSRRTTSGPPPKPALKASL